MASVSAEEWAQGRLWENDSIEVLWRDAGRVFCRLWRNDLEGEKHAFIPIPAGVEPPTLESVRSLAPRKYGTIEKRGIANCRVRYD